MSNQLGLELKAVVASTALALEQVSDLAVAIRELIADCNRDKKREGLSSNAEKLIALIIAPEAQEEMIGDYTERHMPRWRKKFGHEWAAQTCCVINILFAGALRIAAVGSVIAFFWRLRGQ